MGSSADGKIYKSENSGLLWNLVYENSQGEQVKIDVNQQDPSRVYAILANASGGLLEIVRSEDGGNSFQQVYNDLNLLGWECDGNDEGGQAFYDVEN